MELMPLPTRIWTLLRKSLSAQGNPRWGITSGDGFVKGRISKENTPLMLVKITNQISHDSEKEEAARTIQICKEGGIKFNEKSEDMSLKNLIGNRGQGMNNELKERE
ncbi:hypothetical protein PIB30_048511 [Stylosanthes scabra]|uniref:Uncharacterized protein n=1 Tax=Stylosanthes scabra TaxID=79078 RepID=A0ABU6WI42_9FABA|nr:hypothetical protein [Stylosanthes scabra]